MVTRDSTRLLLISNALTAVAALILKWPLDTLLWPYWIQSVLIGWYSRRRILALRQFSTDGFTSNDRPVPETPQALRSTANFLVLHYGIFHLVYLGFLLSRVSALSMWDWLAFAGLTASFLSTHGASFRQNLEADLNGRPNLGTIFFLPYLRVVPMHVAVLLGSKFSAASAGAVLFFIALKTAADILMHRVEHHLLQREGSPEADPPLDAG